MRQSGDARRSLFFSDNTLVRFLPGTSPMAAMLDEEESATKWRCKTKQRLYSSRRSDRRLDKKWPTLSAANSSFSLLILDLWRRKSDGSPSLPWDTWLEKDYSGGSSLLSFPRKKERTNEWMWRQEVLLTAGKLIYFIGLFSTFDHAVHSIFRTVHRLHGMDGRLYRPVDGFHARPRLLVLMRNINFEQEKLPKNNESSAKKCKSSKGE